MNSVSFLRPALAALIGAAFATLAPAGESGSMPASVPPAYTRECASCHVAYPPGLLPAASWQRLMTGLDRHFGSDASLDPDTVRQLSIWLQAHAGSARRMREAPPQDRITRSAWFRREHAEIAPAVWSLPSVRSPANCAACHVGADRGVFDEDELRFPAGLDRRDRRAWQ
ncbi:diheme cytochrome c [Caldimonas sp. KR1-144]|uniref:diheme cytochrome c n=1 Tax=Caldimonas sp. KR1-144 TaxID=3400911 RepID=UPI003C07F6CA